MDFRQNGTVLEERVDLIGKKVILGLIYITMWFWTFGELVGRNKIYK